MRVPGCKISLKFVILILGIVLLGGILIWKNLGLRKEKMPANVVRNENDGLKTYRDKNSGFDIKYTQGRRIGKENIDGTEAVYIFNKEDIEEKEKCRRENEEKIRRGVNFSPSPCRFGIYISLQTQSQWGKQYVIESFYPLPVSRDALKLNRDYLAPDLAVAIPFPDNSEKFVLLESYYDEGEALALMLPTFKFIKADETANWQTYRNVALGIEFKYPPAMILQSTNVEDEVIAAFMDASNTVPRLSTLPDISLRILALSSPPREDINFKNVLIEDVVFDGSGLHPDSFSEFSAEKIGENTVYSIQSGLFEGILSMNYYLIKESQVFVFELHSSPVDWTNPDFRAENDPLNRQVQQIISTVKFFANTP